jgi:nucleotide-binding universal stress UspA family protein
MSRPKGSKNKKTLLSEAQLDDKIAAQRASKRKLEAEQQKILNNMEDLKVQLKAKKKELRAAEKTLATLEEKKTQVDAIAAAVAQKAEIEKVVSSLISSGKAADEILDLLSK